MPNKGGEGEVGGVMEGVYTGEERDRGRPVPKTCVHIEGAILTSH